MPGIARILILSMFGLWVAMTARTAAAAAMSDYDESELWFNSLPESDRNEIQAALIWTGGYNQIQDGLFGKNTFSAIKAFESEIGSYPDGVLTHLELDRLRVASESKKRSLGFKRVFDQTWKFWIGLPTSSLGTPKVGEDGTEFEAKDNRLYLLVTRSRYEGGSFSSTYRKTTSQSTWGRIEFRTFRPTFFIFAGVNANLRYYVRFQDDNGSAIGFIAMWRDGNDSDIQRLIVAISNSIESGNASPSAHVADLKSPVAPEADPSPEIERRQLPEIAKKLAQSGTGFFVSSEGHLITNAHVVEGCREARIRLADGREIQTAIVARNERMDLALLKSQVGGPSVATFRVSPPLRLGTQIIIFGFPRPDILTSTGNLVNGLLSGLAGPNDNAALLQVSAPVQSGNSGGAVLDLSGNVIGVVVAKTNIIGTSDNDIEVMQQANFAIHGDVVRSFLTDQRVSFSYRASVEERQTADIADLAKSFTANIVCQPN